MSGLVYYGREDCPLCAEMLAALAPWAAARGLALEIRDVDQDPQARRRYGLKVPVVEVDGLCACAGHLDLAELERLFRASASAR